MSQSIAVLCPLFGDYDTVLTPPKQTIEADWILVTDQPGLEVPGWRTLFVDPDPLVTPIMQVKRVLCRPDWYSKADILITVGAQAEIKSPHFVQWCIGCIGDNDIALFEHPDRQTLTAEAETCMAMAKCAGMKCREQVAHYIGDLHPDIWGLWATGVIVRDRLLCANIGDAWLAEIEKWTTRDQLSLPVVLRDLGIHVAPLTLGTLWDNPFIGWRPHKEHTAKLPTTLEFCRVCSHRGLTPLWQDGDKNTWHRCLTCNSDSSDGLYRRGLYGKQFLDRTLARVGGMDGAKKQLTNNISQFDRFSLVGAGRRFLDIGVLEGAAMEMMAERGWEVCGFDVDESSDRSGVVIAPEFSASLFGKRFDAILCREVIEHIDGWRGFLGEVTASLNRYGILQVQTPKPTPQRDGNGYGSSHLQLFSPVALEAAVKAFGYRTLARQEWDMGQMWVFELGDVL